jgi:hypothetical protein
VSFFILNIKFKLACFFYIVFTLLWIMWLGTTFNMYALTTGRKNITDFVQKNRFDGVVTAERHRRTAAFSFTARCISVINKYLNLKPCV